MRLGIVGFVALLGCNADKPPDQAAEAPPPVMSEHKPDPQPPAVDPVGTTRRHDLHGIVVTHLADGQITIAGPNRWGRPLDATYTSERYLRDAVPVLSRMLTPEQAAALQALVSETQP